ncbi:MAG: hypothetical protein PQJ60_15140, partial [Spirochaetales bacterium]|nr:hypothetical protein [Spirochaetales bacterium]
RIIDGDKTLVCFEDGSSYSLKEFDQDLLIVKYSGFYADANYPAEADDIPRIDGSFGFPVIYEFEMLDSESIIWAIENPDNRTLHNPVVRVREYNSKESLIGNKVINMERYLSLYNAFTKDLYSDGSP